MGDQQTLTKTLTFGLGLVMAYDTKAERPLPLADEKRMQIYTSLMRASRAIGQACNIESAQLYAAKVMGVSKEEWTKYAPSNPAIRQRLDDCAILGGAVLSQVFKCVAPHFTGEHGKDLLYHGRRQLPTHRTDGTHPIPVRGDVTKLLRFENHFFLVQQIFESKWAKENGLPNWIGFPIRAKKRDRTLIDQLEKVLNKEWELKNSRLFRNPRRKTWIGQIAVAYTPQPYKNLSPSTIMGIDVGVNAPATVHVRVDGIPHPWAQRVGNGRELLASRSVVKNDIRRIIRALRAKNSGLVGKARDEARERLRDLRRREKRVIKTASQRIAARITEIARRNGAGKWQIEDLSEGIKDDSWLARNWAPGTLIDALRWNAQKLGAVLVKVDPRRTSQRCSICGHIDPANRPKGKMGAAAFQCVSCGHSEDADKNAARNLSTPGIADLISEWLKNKGV